MSTERSFSWKVPILQLLKNRTVTVFELQDWYWYQKKRNFVMFKVTEVFFSIFEFWQKLHRLKFQFFRKKNIFLKKKMYNSNTKVKLKKITLNSFVEHEILLRLIYVSTVWVEPFDRSSRYCEPLFLRFLWITRL